MRTVFFIPPLSRMSGGLATLYAMAAALCGQGRAVALTCPGGKAAGFEAAVQQMQGDESGQGSAAGPEILPWEDLKLTSSDIWLVPESWPNAISAGVSAGAQTVVYAQSWNFLLTTLPEGVRWKQLPVRFLAVSHPVAWFMENVLELHVEGILPPAVHPEFYRQGSRPAKRVRVAWMPRKNRALAEQIQQVAMADLARTADAPVVEWVPVQNCSLQEVAELFSSCHLFLATAFPEGFGLPPLEAMASGCVPVGFTGFGGWEYMRQALYAGEEPPRSGSDVNGACAASVMSKAYTPSIPLQEKPWTGNGFFFSDGDIMATGLGLAAAIRMAHASGSAWQEIVQAGRTAAEYYSQAAQVKALDAVWSGLSG